MKKSAVLPISNAARSIRVAGSAADNVGKQAGAWTVEWQGIDGNWLPGATSILAGIREVAPVGTTVEFNASGTFPGVTGLADVGIAVVGESPYAEGWGDNAHPELQADDIATIENLKKVSKKVVVVLVSGRPLFITDELPKWDSFVTAWLPGSEGAGVADILFGKQKVVGTLPLPWPATVAQLPVSSTGTTTDGTPLLFPRHFGLTFDESSN